MQSICVGSFGPPEIALQVTLPPVRQQHRKRPKIWLRRAIRTLHSSLARHHFHRSTFINRTEALPKRINWMCDKLAADLAAAVMNGIDSPGCHWVGPWAKQEVGCSLVTSGVVSCIAILASWWECACVSVCSCMCRREETVSSTVCVCACVCVHCRWKARPINQQGLYSFSQRADFGLPLHAL